MARKQFLINYHSSGNTAPVLSNVKFGEIVVQHHETDAKLFIKRVNKDGAEELVDFIDREKIQELIETLSTKVNSDLTNYYKKTEVDIHLENAIGSAKTYTDEEIVKVKTGLTADLGEVSSQISALSKELDTFESACSATYETIENVKLISANTLTSAKTYTDGKFDEVASALTDNVGEINQKFEQVGNRITAFESAVSGTYATKAELSGKVETLTNKIDSEISGVNQTIEATESALTSEISSLSQELSQHKTNAEQTYAKKSELSEASATTIASAKEYTDTKVSAATVELGGQISSLAQTVDKLSGDTENAISSLTETINNKVASAYIFKGSVDSKSELPVSGNVKGDVYNVVNAEGEPGTENYIPAGTNYAWDGEKWDALGGVVDLSAYAKTETVNGQIQGVQKEIEELSGAVDTKFESYYIKSEVDTHLENAIGSAKTYTDEEIVKVKTGLTADLGEVNQKFEQVGNRITNFESAVSGTYATKAELSGEVETLINQINSEISGVNQTIEATESALTSEISSLSQELSQHKTNAEQTYAKKSELSAATASTIASAKGYTDEQVSSATTELRGEINGLDTRIDSLEALSAATQSALQTIEVTNISGVTSTRKDANTWTIDMGSMIVDGGSY